jgi:transcription antitermination factor NusA-like protein
VIVVDEDQLSRIEGRRGENLVLASRLCGWDIQPFAR